MIPWNEDYSVFIANALSPAKVLEVRPDFISKVATVVVPPDYQLSLAIGRKDRTRASLPRLRAGRIDIKSESQVGLVSMPNSR